MLPQRDGDKQQLPGVQRSGAKSYEFDACLPGSTTQARLGIVGRSPGSAPA
jgi:hypothetical protein